MRIGDVRMDFKYQDYFGTAPATGYETLLYDVMTGDATLFQRADNIEAGWSVVQPILDDWAKNAGKALAFYPCRKPRSAGSGRTTGAGRSRLAPIIN